MLSVSSDEMMTKISDFALIPELKTLVVGSGGGAQNEAYLKLFKIQINPKTFMLDTQPYSKLKKETSGKVIEL